ncbi:gephyrin-like molybdotransferase Glp [Pedobacter sp. UYP1]|uniref:molybdopterin molybdotransferase MoeA n=1 Tax=Pedobacter sp. UYP1 TaxID=1756396 RepID=UPI0033934B13
MISVSEAKNLIDQNIKTLSPTKFPIQECCGHILAEDVFALCDIPAFQQSSMDGYAIRFEDRLNPLTLIGEMAAGTTMRLKIGKGQTTRIFTGAALPEGADTVVMQEKVTLQDGDINILDTQLIPGAHVRAIGAEIKASALAIKHGHLLNAAAIGFLAGIGISEVVVYPMPEVSIIITGKEFCPPGKTLEFGQVYESNSYTLKAALTQAGIFNIKILYAADDLKILQETLVIALQQSDAVLLTGGVSVGDYDYVALAAAQSGVRKIFHKVKQKPGKPLYFGLHTSTPIFGLPGNPSSVLSCFYNYVLPALSKMANKDYPLKKTEATLTEAYQKPSGLTHFLKGFYQDGMVKPLYAQESFRLSSFAQANCMICLNEHQENFKENEIVVILLLPE